MPHVMFRWQFKDSTGKALVDKPEDRTSQARSLVESFGGKLSCYYFSFGDYDGLAICEFPDATSAAALSMRAAATGIFSRYETTMLLTGAEAEAAMRMAQSAKTSYRAPGG